MNLRQARKIARRPWYYREPTWQSARRRLSRLGICAKMILDLRGLARDIVRKPQSVRAEAARYNEKLYHRRRTICRMIQELRRIDPAGGA